jgi:hypothetical protein
MWPFQPSQNLKPTGFGELFFIRVDYDLTTICPEIARTGAFRDEFVTDFAICNERGRRPSPLVFEN